MDARNLDLLLLICPPWDTQRPPIHLAGLASFAKARGFAVDALDLNVKFHRRVKDGALAPLWRAMSDNSVRPEDMDDAFFAGAAPVLDEFADDLAARPARALGFSVNYQNAPFTEQLVRRLRARDPARPILYGGPGVTAAFLVGELPRLTADAFAIGEGEETLAEALSACRAHGRFVALPGLILREHGRLSEFQPRPPIADLDDLPFPTYEEFDLAEYDQTFSIVKLPFLFSRGCANHCAFCMDHALNGRFRVRSAANAAAELTQHVRRYGVTHFEFNDLICNGSLRALEELADRVVAEGLRLEWSSYAVIRRNLTHALFDKLRAAGCHKLMFGLESASDHVLRLMNKNYTAQVAEEAIRHCSRAGIETTINLIVGFPGETRRDHEATLEFVRRNAEFIDEVSNLGACLLAPCTALSQTPERFGVEREPQRGTWRGPDGNTREERNRRVDEVGRLLRELGIPLTFVNRESLARWEPPNRGLPAAAPAVEPLVAIDRVTLLDRHEVVAAEFRRGEPLTAALRFRANASVPAPLFRAQLFSRGNRYGKDVFVHGTNTARFGLALGAASPGEGEARLRYEALHLAPGEYRLRVGVWPDEQAPAPFAERGDLVLRIAGPVDPDGGVAAMPVQWRVAEPASVGAAAVDDLRLLGDAADGVLRPEQALRASFACAAAVVPRATIYRDGFVIHRAVCPAPPAAAARLELTYPELRLLAGVYLLVVADAARPATARHAFFAVRSDRAHGAGVVSLPCFWRVRLPSPGPSAKS